MKRNVGMLVILICFSLCMSCSKAKPKLHLYMWAAYIDPDLVAEFEKRFDCRVVIDTYDSNECMYAKLKLGSSGYDIIFPSKYILDLMHQQHFVLPIDHSKIPNLRYQDVERIRYLDKSPSPVGVPYSITYSGIGYRKDRVKQQEVNSWDIFSSSEYKGRMTMLNDVRETIGAALKYLGYSINTRNQDEINKAVEQLLKWKKCLAKFESEQYKNGIASAEYVVVQGYSGDISQVISENENVGFVFPKEGAIFSCDYIALLKGTEQAELAHEFINFLYDPEISAKNMQFTHYLCPNRAAYDLLPSDFRDNSVIFIPPELMRISETIEYLGDDQEKYNRAWDIVKSSY